MFSSMLRTVSSQRASIQQGARRIRNLNLPVTCSVRNFDRTWGTNAGRDNI